MLQIGDFSPHIAGEEAEPQVSCHLLGASFLPVSQVRGFLQEDLIYSSSQ
jgi:hypothetical protein